MMMVEVIPAMEKREHGGKRRRAVDPEKAKAYRKAWARKKALGELRSAQDLGNGCFIMETNDGARYLMGPSTTTQETAAERMEERDKQ